MGIKSDSYTKTTTLLHFPTGPVPYKVTNCSNSPTNMVSAEVLVHYLKSLNTPQALTYMHAPPDHVVMKYLDNFNQQLHFYFTY